MSGSVSDDATDIDGDGDDDDNESRIELGQVNNKQTSDPNTNYQERMHGNTGNSIDGAELMLRNWTLTPLISAAIDGSKYLVDGNLLTIINLTKLDQKDEYKCLAINSLGQVASQKFQLSVNCK